MRKNARLYLYLFWALLLSSLLVACGNQGGGSSEESSTSLDEEVTLLINNHGPSTHHLAVNALEPWAKLVEDKTNGRVKTEVYHGGALGGGTTVWDDVSGGVYDVGFISVPTEMDKPIFPWSIGGLAFLFDQSEGRADIIQEVAPKFINEEEFRNIIVMGTTVTDGYYFQSKDPITSINDLKGKMIRVAGSDSVDLIESLGATPVSLDHSELYEGLQRGTVDMALYPPSGSVGMKLYEVAPYYLNVRVSTGVLAPVMNKSFFDGLPEDLQKLFEEELNPQLAQLMTESYNSEFEKVFDILKEEGATVVDLSEEDINKLTQKASVQWDGWLEMANSRGYAGEEMVNDILEVIENSGMEVPNVRGGN